MEVKIIKLRKNAKPKDAKKIFSSLGYECVKFSVDRRTRGKQKVIEIIRDHRFYSKNLINTLILEGVISILGRRDFWLGSPDYVIWNNEEIYFCEFKSHRDVFRVNQIEWFEKFDMLPTAIAMALE